MPAEAVLQRSEEAQRHHEAEDRHQVVHEEHARRSEERFRLLVESVKDYAIFMLDPTGHVMSWNAGAQRIKGYSAEEIIGQHFSRFYPAADIAAGKCEYELAEAEREGRFEDESPRLRKDGTLFFANVVITALRDASGALVGFAKVTRDLTERKKHEQERMEHARAEEARRAAEANGDRLRQLAEELRDARDRAEAATKVKDEFLVTVSHELRSPLNAIVGWSRLLQSGSLPEDKRQRALDTILRNALAQNQLIEELLDVSRIVAGKLRLEMCDADLVQITSAAVDVVRPAADAKGVSVHVACSSDAAYAHGDPARLQQVLWNLLTNAVKFTPRGGQVRIDVSPRDCTVEIAVRDTGAGIAPEFLPRVFNRFEQAEDGNPTGRRTGGLGLGLSIVKHIVELHGGTVEAQSEGLGMGATFVVSLPARAEDRAAVDGTPAPARSAADQEAYRRPSELDGLRVLVIDDEPDCLGVVRAILEECGARVVSANTTAEAFERLRSEPKPHVIVSDIAMPGEDGYAFVRRLRALPHQEGGRIPAVALTAFARAEDRRRALGAGFQNHASKPIEPQELLMVVASLAGRFR